MSVKLGDLLAGVPLTGEIFDQELEITSISYDTRTLVPAAERRERPTFPRRWSGARRRCSAARPPARGPL